MKERKEYIDKMADQLKSWDNELSRYQEKANKLSGDAKNQYQESITNLKERKDRLQEKLDNLRQSSDNAWKELKAGFEKSWSDLRESFSKARNKL